MTNREAVEALVMRLEKVDVQPSVDGALTIEAYEMILSAMTAYGEECLKPFKGARNPGEWEDNVWWAGRNYERERIKGGVLQMSGVYSAHDAITKTVEIIDNVL